MHGYEYAKRRVRVTTRVGSNDQRVTRLIQ